MSNCTKLRFLLLFENALEGPIPSEILTTTTRLQYLYLHSNNSLTESIPKALANCSSLEVLVLASNHLYGITPPELGSLNRLQQLWLSNNSLGGPICSLMDCTALKIFDLHGSKVEGTIPEDIGYKLSKLESIDFASNRLTGSIPMSLGNCSTFYYLQTTTTRIGDAEWSASAYAWFEGSIPEDIGLKLTNLKRFLVDVNQFSGGIPKSLGNCSQLSFLHLSSNL
ncbi:hypothetical protein SUGI_0228120 [Cryptomeria japonica]|nr:hypothetical protein SUGI_0228120 [Cryptomeria japonica]